MVMVTYPHSHEDNNLSSKTRVINNVKMQSSKITDITQVAYTYHNDSKDFQVEL